MVDGRKKTVYMLLLLILAVYPLRHIWLGVEVTDGAYSAGNYRFLEAMNPMWLFATYLANMTGRFLTNLPGGATLMGLNFYAALFISIMAVLCFLFLTKTARMDGRTVFFGELLAVSLCWCPVTILYNYMTYFFFTLGIMALYLGLVKEKRLLLFCAGILLGVNVLVRFPNLTEAALIVSLWYYGFLQRKRLKDVLQETGVCLFGYLAGIGAVLFSVSMKYGLQEYTAGIFRLLQMPEEASDYSAFSMVLTVLLDYKFSAKWLLHMAALAAAGCFISFLACKLAKDKLGKGAFLAGKAFFCGGILILFYGWYRLGVFNIRYYTYESMFQWVAVFLILVIAAGIYVLFSGKYSRNEKLLSSMILILIAVTPLGSNNHLYPNMNNMFLVFPFGLSVLGKFLRKLREADDVYPPWERGASLFPVRAMLTAFLGVMSLQCLLFGAVFTFRDGMSGQKRDTKIEKNAILRGMVTNAPLANALEELTEYVEAEGLSGRSVILYGQVPGLSYMLGMPPAISTAWPDLASYHYEVMAEDMAKLNENAGEAPLIILGTGVERLVLGEELTEGELIYYSVNEKWNMLYDYIIERGYEKTFGNDMFAVYQEKQ